MIYTNYDPIMYKNLYLKLYKILFKSVGKFGTEAQTWVNTDKRTEMAENRAIRPLARYTP
jgi:hypothetical protein